MEKIKKLRSGSLEKEWRLLKSPALIKRVGLFLFHSFILLFFYSSSILRSRTEFILLFFYFSILSPFLRSRTEFIVVAKWRSAKKGRSTLAGLVNSVSQGEFPLTHVSLFWPNGIYCSEKCVYPVCVMVVPPGVTLCLGAEVLFAGELLHVCFSDTRVCHRLFCEFRQIHTAEHDGALPVFELDVDRHVDFLCRQVQIVIAIPRGLHHLRFDDECSIAVGLVSACARTCSLL